MRPGASGPLKAALLLLASLCAWFSGFLLAQLIPEAPLTSAVHSLRSFGQRPLLKAPSPRRQTCGQRTRCAADTYSFHLLSGGGPGRPAAICFQDQLLTGEKTGNVSGGLTVTVIS
ncbi:protein FAM3B, partial [Erinaceus europaeus]|uniref:Protein FAM3B n=1 Tax=Erinaceus europaeus TaxID=9365 RepID=A0ABM3WW10_ERIEU